MFALVVLVANVVAVALVITAIFAVDVAAVRAAAAVEVGVVAPAVLVTAVAIIVDGVVFQLALNLVQQGKVTRGAAHLGEGIVLDDGPYLSFVKF